MALFWKFIYNLILIPLLYVAYKIYAVFNPKAQDGIKGRKGLFSRLSKQVPIGLEERGDLPVIWFHCASVGEFEQARPIIAKVKDRARIFVTFFSPSIAIDYHALRRVTDISGMWARDPK